MKKQSVSGRTYRRTSTNNSPTASKSAWGEPLIDQLAIATAQLSAAYASNYPELQVQPALRLVPDEEQRQRLARLAFAATSKWQLSKIDSLRLLGVSEENRAQHARYSAGEAALPAQRDVLDRAQLVLAIHQLLRNLYEDEEAYAWMRSPHIRFGGITPLQIGIDSQSGLIEIRNYLQHLLH